MGKKEEGYIWCKLSSSRSIFVLFKYYIKDFNLIIINNKNLQVNTLKLFIIINNNKKIVYMKNFLSFKGTRSGKLDRSSQRSDYSILFFCFKVIFYF